jgi:hypothetical protein
MLGAGAVLGMAFLIMKRRDATRLREALDRRDDQLTEELDESFPASDPPSHTPTMGSSVPR